MTRRRANRDRSEGEYRYLKFFVNHIHTDDKLEHFQAAFARVGRVIRFVRASKEGDAGPRNYGWVFFARPTPDVEEKGPYTVNGHPIIVERTRDGPGSDNKDKHRRRDGDSPNRHDRRRRRYGHSDSYSPSRSSSLSSESSRSTRRTPGSRRGRKGDRPMPDKPIPPPPRRQRLEELEDPTAVGPRGNYANPQAVQPAPQPPKDSTPIPQEAPQSTPAPPMAVAPAPAGPPAEVPPPASVAPPAEVPTPADVLLSIDTPRPSSSAPPPPPYDDSKASEPPTAPQSVASLIPPAEGPKHTPVRHGGGEATFAVSPPAPDMSFLHAENDLFVCIPLALCPPQFCCGDPRIFSARLDRTKVGVLNIAGPVLQTVAQQTTPVESPHSTPSTVAAPPGGMMGAGAGWPPMMRGPMHHMMPGMGPQFDPFNSLGHFMMGRGGGMRGGPPLPGTPELPGHRRRHR